MRRRKLLIVLICAFLFFGAANVWAESSAEWFKGQPVRVYINDQLVESGGMLVEKNNQVMLPLRDIADTLQAIVNWNEETKTVRMYKPNVHIFLSTRNKDGSFGTFGKVFHKETHNFFIFSQIDSLVKDVDAFKFEIVDPQGKKVYEHTHQLQEISQDVLWVTTPNIELKFERAGEYKVKLYMKMSSDDSFQLVSEKVFHSDSRS